MKFFDELKRRNVFKETLAYLVVSWVLLQVASLMLPIFDAPIWVLKTITFTLIIGLPIWIFFSWTYQVTNEGFKKTSKISEEQSTNTATYKRLNIIILITLVIAIIIAVFDHKSTISFQKNNSSDLAKNNSIAVLPFLDMSPNKDQDYLSYGIAEDILNRLCKFKELRVAAATSSFSFKDKNEDIKTIGEKLNVSNILEGSVRKNDTDIIITVRLTNSENGFTLLSETFTDNLDNMVGLQSNIALNIAKKIESKLSNRGEQLLQSKKINPLAFESFIKGKSQFMNGPLNMLSGEIYRPKNYFESAIKIDSTFAEAHAYLALTYFNLADWVLPKSEKSKIATALDSAELLSKRALSLDSLNSAAHLAMGSYYFHQYNWLEAEKEKRKAVALNPGGSEEKFTLASFLGQFGQAEEALTLSREALQLDPLDVRSKIKYARDLYRARQYDLCIQQCELILNEDPNSVGALQFQYLSYSAKKEFQDAGKTITKIAELRNDEQLAKIYGTFDYKTAIRKIISDIEDPANKSIIGGPIQTAMLYAEIEDKGNTFKYLDTIYNNKLPQISFLSQHTFDFLRDDPRYLELYEKAGFKAYYDYKSKKL